MKEYKVEYTHEFADRLQELYEYISTTYGNPVDALHLADKIRQRCRGLSIFPKASSIKMVCSGHEFRFLKVGHHVAIYTVDDERRLVTVWTLIYAQRDIEGLLGGDEQ